MASLSAQQQHELALSAAYEDDTPTPLGWRRKLIPHIGKGLVPARTDVIFIAPNGEEFKSKVQLQRYLKGKKGGPSLSEFIWITDETPRRPSRSAAKHSKSPPKSASRKKPAACPPQESRGTNRRRRTTNEEVEGSQGNGNKRPKGETLVESTDDMEASPTWSSAKDNKKKKPFQDTEEKNARGETESPVVSSEADMSEDSSELQESKNLEEDGKDGEIAVNREEEDMDMDGKSKSRAAEKQEAMDKSISQEHCRTKNIHVDSKNSNDDDDDDDEDKDVCVKDDQDGSKDGTTLSLLGSDFSTDGMEAESDDFESVKDESPKAEKDRSEGIPDSSEKDLMMIMSPKSHSIDEAAK